jgi:hypothetical protein
MKDKSKRIKHYLLSTIATHQGKNNTQIYEFKITYATRVTNFAGFRKHDLITWSSCIYHPRVINGMWRVFIQSKTVFDLGGITIVVIDRRSSLLAAISDDYKFYLMTLRMPVQWFVFCLSTERILIYFVKVIHLFLWRSVVETTW